MSDLLDRFECVRIVRMNGVDLSLFQFDYDQTWAVMFFRHDGTILARYGTRADKDGMKYNSLAGFNSAMRRVLSVEENWQTELQPFYDAKRGPKPQFATAEQIPSQTIRNIKAREKQAIKDGKPSERQSCVHCHNVYDAHRDFAIDNGKYDPAKRYKYPLPHNIGLEVDELTRIVKVQADSPVAGRFTSGEIIKRVAGQNVHTLADIQFALHHISDPGEVTIETVAIRNQDPASATTGEAASRTTTIKLPAGWRTSDMGWRASMYSMPPKPGLWIEALSETEKRKQKIAPDKLALKVRGLFGSDVRKSDLKKNDIIVQFADRTHHHSAGDFHAHLRLNFYKPNSTLPLKILRNGKPLEVSVLFANE